MDPNETLRVLIDAAVAGEATRMMEMAHVLNVWLLSGGFAPADPRESVGAQARRMSGG